MTNRNEAFKIWLKDRKPDIVIMPYIEWAGIADDLSHDTQVLMAPPGGDVDGPKGYLGTPVRTYTSQSTHRRLLESLEQYGRVMHYPDPEPLPLEEQEYYWVCSSCSSESTYEVLTIGLFGVVECNRCGRSFAQPEINMVSKEAFSMIVEENQKYLLQNCTAGYVGFWREGGSGYTPWIDEAKRWTLKEADAQIRSTSGTHSWKLWSLDAIEAIAKRTVDIQDMQKTLGSGARVTEMG